MLAPGCPATPWRSSPASVPFAPVRFPRRAGSRQPRSHPASKNRDPKSALPKQSNQIKPPRIPSRPPFLRLSRFPPISGTRNPCPLPPQSRQNPQQSRLIVPHQGNPKISHGTRHPFQNSAIRAYLRSHTPAFPISEIRHPSFFRQSRQKTPVIVPHQGISRHPPKNTRPLGAWRFSGAWRLEFGASPRHPLCDFASKTQQSRLIVPHQGKRLKFVPSSTSLP